MASFRTKRGYCHIDSDTLQLESSFLTQFKHYREGNPRTFLSSLLLIGFSIGYPIYLYVTGSTTVLLYWAGAVGLVLAGAIAFDRWRGYSHDDEIPLVDITHVRTEREAGSTGPRLVVFYTQNGENRRRPILMPPQSLSFSDEEFERARELFQDHEIPIER